MVSATETECACLHCGDAFVAGRHNQRFCSPACRSAHWAATNRESREASVRKYREDNREKTREANRRYRRSNPERVLEITQRYREANPEKHRAHAQVHSAIRSGRLVRPDQCLNCRADGPLHAHHPDYSRPLDVEWLCPGCHKAAHAEAV